jgi:tartrate dehydrogenase/decarboxylase/D-malate dehydrogenase
MMLDHIGQPEAARALITSFESTLAAGVHTRDLGGDASTGEFTASVLDRCREVGSHTVT